MTTAPRTATTRAIRAAQRERLAAVYRQAADALATNTCPVCSAGVHLNLAIRGWVQCDRFGSGHFRRDMTGNACEWQAFMVDAYNLSLAGGR
jgi:hypothetical protein